MSATRTSFSDDHKQSAAVKFKNILNVLEKGDYFLEDRITKEKLVINKNIIGERGNGIMFWGM